MKNQAGSALIITLLMITILVALVVEFAYETYMDTTSLSNWKNGQQASLIAKSGQTLSTKYLEEVIKLKYTDIGEIALPVDYDFGPGIGLTIKMEDENAKFNINGLIRENGKPKDEAIASLKKLFEYLNINTDLALVIADWIDPDAEPRIPGSEDNAKNTYLWSVEELKLINGMDKTVLDAITPYITVYGDGSIVDNKFDSKININTAQLPVLVCLHPDMTDTLAKRLIDYRENTPFETAGQEGNVSGMGSISSQLQGRINYKSSIARVTSTAAVNEIKRTIESIVDTSGKIYFWREA